METTSKRVVSTKIGLLTVQTVVTFDWSHADESYVRELAERSAVIDMQREFRSTGNAPERFAFDLSMRPTRRGRTFGPRTAAELLAAYNALAAVERDRFDEDVTRKLLDFTQTDEDAPIDEDEADRAE